MTKNNSKEQQKKILINDTTLEIGDLIEFVDTIWLITYVKNKFQNVFLDIVCIYDSKQDKSIGAFIKQYNMTCHDQNRIMSRSLYDYNIIK